MNPYSTAKPESPDYVAPFLRTGPGKAPDGQPKFDLDRENPEFYDRLHRFLSLASDYGIVVEVVLFSNTYSPEVWSLNPLHADANVNGLPRVPWPEYLTQRHGALLERQLAHVRRIVTETNRYDNILYEVCNEPGGGAPGSPDNPSPAEVDEWQMAIAAEIRRTEAALSHRHLIAGQEAFTYEPWEQPATRSFRNLDFDVVNMHPLPGMPFAGRTYDLGGFMSKELKLGAVRDYCLATRDERKPLNLDEDNVASQYKDYDGWTIHRKRAWTTLLSGCHYDYIDFSIINYCETGTEESRRCIRSWMGHLSRFVHSLDLARARPDPSVVRAQPAHVLPSVLAVPGEDYAIYLADERELGQGVGQPIEGEVVLDLPPGAYRAALFSAETGLYGPWVPLQGGGGVQVGVLEFRHDIVLRVRRT